MSTEPLTVGVTADDLLSDLVAELGADAVVTDPTVLRQSNRDAWPITGKWSAQDVDAHVPLCLVRPSSTDQVAHVMRTSQSYGVPVVPMAGRSGVVGGAQGRPGTISLDLGAADAVLDFSPADARVRVQAGVNGGELERMLNAEGYTLGHYPQSLNISTVGGWIATRSTGTFSAAYGGIEQMVRGLTVVLADGTVVHLPALVRGSVGPDLLQLFCGSEGTLGVVTEVELRALALPPVRVFEGWELTDLEQAVADVRRLFDARLQPPVIRLYDATEAAHLYQRAGLQPAGPALIVGYEGTPSVVDAQRAAVAAVLTAGGAVGHGEPLGEAWESGRYRADWLAEGNAGPTRIADSIEISTTWTRLLPLYETVMRRLSEFTHQPMAHWSHFYPDGCGMYVIFNIEGRDADQMAESYHRAWSVVMEEASRFGAAISHHHGIGRARADRMEEALGDGAGLLARVKDLLDPDHLLNPGTLIPTELVDRAAQRRPSGGNR